MYKKLWKSKTHCIVDLSLSALALAYMAKKMADEKKTMKQWDEDIAKIKKYQATPLVLIKS